MKIRHLLHWLTPFGLVQHRRQRLACARLGLDIRRAGVLLGAATLARYELWPQSLREASDFRLVDVGANRGQFALAVCELKPGATVCAIEPQTSCCEFLRTASRDLPGFIVEEAAVGASEQLADFNVLADDVSSSMLVPALGIQRHYEGDGMKVSKKIKVRMRPLDAIVPEGWHISLLKIDAQGYEGEVLAGASATLARTSCVLIEINYQNHYLGESDFTDLHLMLLQNGFELYGISEPFYSESRPLWADALYRRKDV